MAKPIIPSRGQTFNAGANTTVQILGTAKSRRSVTFSLASTSGAVLLGPNSLVSTTDPTGVLGLNSAGTTAYTLTYDTHGEVVRQAWFARSVAGVTLCVIECADPED